MTQYCRCYRCPLLDGFAINEIEGGASKEFAGKAPEIIHELADVLFGVLQRSSENVR